MSAETSIYKQGRDFVMVTNNDNGTVNKRYLRDDDMRIINRIYGPQVEDGLLIRYPSKDMWKFFTTETERTAWMDAWKLLSAEDRSVYIVGHHKGDSLPELAEKLGFTDVEEQRIGMCGSPDPIISHKSEQFQSRLEQIEGSMIENLTQKGILSSADLDWQRGKRFSEIGFAVDHVIGEQEGFVEAPDLYSDDWSKWYTKRQDVVCDYLLAA